MRRVMSLWLPRWPIDRRRSGQSPAPDKPFALAQAVGNRRLVAAANPAAEALGILPGLPLTDARALHPALAVAEADPAGDAAALARLAQWCNRYSPWTAPHGGDGIWLDVTGCAHLQGGEAALAREVVERLARHGVEARAAIADTPGAAWAQSRCGGAASAVVPPGAARPALAPLPIAALRLDPAQAVELERLGLRRIGDLYPLPRADLAARFGDAVALRLDQALGTAAEPLSPLPPAPARWVRRRFAEPIATPEPIIAAMRELIDALCRALGKEMLGARRIALSCYRVDGAAAEIAIGTARPSREPRHLLRLLSERLAEIDPGLGIEDMVLMATAVERLAAAQLRMGSLPLHSSASCAGLSGASTSSVARHDVDGRDKPGHDAGNSSREIAKQQARALLAAEGRDRDGTEAGELAALVDRLANRLGPQAVARFEPRESHVPERVQRLVPVFAARRAAWRFDPSRPVRLLPRPEPIEAMAPVPDDPPILFRWRRLAHRVRRADGPERIGAEWWRAEAGELRDYYRVEDEEGRRFWLYRAGLFLPETSPRWFLHGLFA